MSPVLFLIYRKSKERECVTKVKAPVGSPRPRHFLTGQAHSVAGGQNSFGPGEHAPPKMVQADETIRRRNMLCFPIFGWDPFVLS